MWIVLSIFSSFFLGIYDVLKKISVDKNAVLPVLFFAIISGAMVFFPILLLSIFFPDNLSTFFLYIPPISLEEHVLFFLKSFIVVCSWIFEYYALKNLPITIAGPIRSTQPVFTLVGAILIYGETLSILQWTGLLITIGGIYLSSWAGNKEGIRFRNNKFVWFMILGTIIGAVSGIFDKYLVTHYNRMAMQTWFSIYLVVIMLPIVYILWYKNKDEKSPFHWRWSILFIGITLSIADFAYFYALSLPGALLAIITVFRRSSVVISFLFGAIWLKEINIKNKAFVLLTILIGIFLIVLGS